MNEQLLKQALIQTTDEMLLNDYANGDNYSYEPSDKFKKRIKKLTENHDKVSFRLTYTCARKTVCILVAILLLMLLSLSAGAVRDTIANFFVEHFSDHAQIQYKNNDEDENAPETIEEVYELGYIPKGYKLNHFSKTDIDVSTVYMSDTGQLALLQIVKKEFDVALDNENSLITTETIDGTDFIIQTSTSSSDISIIWEDDKYALVLLGNLPKNELINLYKSLKIKD